MIQNTDISNTEDGKVDDVPRRDGIRDDAVPKEIFLFKEPIVLISIVGLTLFNGVSFYIEPRNYEQLPNWLVIVSGSSTSAVPLIGSVFATFLSEIIGRKRAYKYIFALSVFSFILVVSSQHPAVLYLIFILQGIIRGGSSVMNALAICEYSSPKHRFAWMMVDFATMKSIGIVVLRTSNTEIVFYTLLVIQIVLGLICLRCIWAWPESPYWLANKGKLEQSKAAFMWLRGKGGREELASVLKARRRPGPPKLFWISLFIALATISVTIFTNIQITQSSILFYDLVRSAREPLYKIHLLVTTAIFSTLVSVSYLTKRKTLFIIVSVISSTLSYAEALCLYLKLSEHHGLLFYWLYNASDVMRTCGPAPFGLILFIETAPYKYNTIISCICFGLLSLSLPLTFTLVVYLNYEVSFHPSASLLLSTTLILGATLLYYFFAPETKDKTLLEIQRSYTPDENDSNPEQNQSMVLNEI